MNPHWLPERKEVELKKMASKFVFSAAVKATKKQKLENCTPEMDDLFRRMFDIDPDNRITFSDIRRHPVFAKHFPIVAEASKILYGKKFQPSKIIKTSATKKYGEKKPANEDDDVRQSMMIFKKKNQNFPEEKEIIERKKDEIDFLKENSEVFIACNEFLKPHERLMLSYNTLKYYIVLLRKFKEMLNKNALNQQYPNRKWNEYVNTQEFKEMVKEANNDLGEE
jgi:serine/threonine protein kinase